MDIKILIRHFTRTCELKGERNNGIAGSRWPPVPYLINQVCAYRHQGVAAQVELFM